MSNEETWETKAGKVNYEERRHTARSHPSRSAKPPLGQPLTPRPGPAPPLPWALLLPQLARRDFPLPSFFRLKENKQLAPTGPLVGVRVEVSFSEGFDLALPLPLVWAERDRVCDCGCGQGWCWCGCWVARGGRQGARGGPGGLGDDGEAGKRAIGNRKGERVEGISTQHMIVTKLPNQSPIEAWTRARIQIRIREGGGCHWRYC